MKCEGATQQLGAYVDGELASTMRDDMEAHISSCVSCRAELESIRELTAELSAPENVPVPQALWTAIENRLDAGQGSEYTARTRRGHKPLRMFGRVKTGGSLAIAAAVVLAVGLGMFSLVWTGSTARAATVDFSVLLDALPEDAQKAFRKFLVLYNGRESSPAAAKQYAPKLSFEVPQMLPGGFELQNVYLLRFGELPGVAASYDRDGEFLAVIFHRPVNKENFGPHQNYPCVVGRHEGHKVSVGEWKFVHLMDPSTCHCVLSKLDEQTELPGIMSAVAPVLAAGLGAHKH